MVLVVAQQPSQVPVIPGQGPFITPDQLLFVGDKELVSVGQRLGARAATTQADIYNPTNPLIVGVSSAASITRLHSIIERRKVLAVVAWRVPEEHLAALYSLNVPIIVGLPDTETLMNTVNHGIDLEDQAVARSYAADLANREAMFELPANSAPN